METTEYNGHSTALNNTQRRAMRNAGISEATTARARVGNVHIKTLARPGARARSLRRHCDR
eukprot:3542933-Lingulodinium_polyedra.AAC.1